VKIGYENRISIESRWQNIEEELPKAIENLKSIIRGVMNDEPHA
jgi:hypothetical protein